MQFKHPEILYGLLLLIIPIIVHLFQLQRFIKTPFTNVKFLQKIVLQTRKSSQLKKWLILLMRLCIFTALIFAFSQPFFSDNSEQKKLNTIIYLDNSLSMQAKINGVEKLKKAAQDIIKNIDKLENVTLITNNHVYKKIDAKSLKNNLLNLNYSPTELDLETVFLKIKQQNIDKTNYLNKIILISDFQYFDELKIRDVTNVNLSISLINLNSEENKNISIDSAYISNKNNQELTLKVIINHTNISKDNLSISLFEDKKLIGKASTLLSKNKLSEVEFKIPTQQNFNGKISIQDENAPFDNTLYFNVNNPEKIEVLSIGKEAPFLSKIYTKNEFNFTQKNNTNLDYNSISNYQLIILNELENISSSLTNALSFFIKNNGRLVIIPSSKIDLNSYNLFFENLNLGSISPSTKKELKITTINYEHPLLSNVFEKQVTNFQYPTTNQTYKTSLNNTASIVNLENNLPFISEIKSNNTSIFWFTSPLNTDITNFQNSPLIVPIFYNFAKYSGTTPQLYYIIGDKNKINIKTNIKKDDVLKFKNDNTEFIPLQQIFNNKVEVTTNEQPEKSGFYQITNSDTILKTIAFNYNRRESKLRNVNLENLLKNNKNIFISNSIEDTFEKINEQQQIKPLFKWFLRLAVLFLLLEIGILKFFKV